MSFDEAMALLSRDERFKATVYAMNTLLIQKGLYSVEEFQQLFIEHAVNYKNGFNGRTAKEASRRAAIAV
jgi:hypothetical protein